MHGEGADAGVFSDFRNAQCIAVVMVPAGADFQGDRDRHGGNHRSKDLGDQALVAHQRRTGGLVADLLGRTTHVDVDDLCAKLNVGTRGIGQHLRVGAGDLNAAWFVFVAMNEPLLGLAALPQAGVAGNHLGNCHARAQPPAQAAKGLIGDAGHGREDQGIGQPVRANGYRRHGSSLPVGMRASERGVEKAGDDTRSG